MAPHQDLLPKAYDSPFHFILSVCVCVCSCGHMLTSQGNEWSEVVQGQETQSTCQWFTGELARGKPPHLSQEVLNKRANFMMMMMSGKEWETSQGKIGHKNQLENRVKCCPSFSPVFMCAFDIRSLYSAKMAIISGIFWRWDPNQ